MNLMCIFRHDYRQLPTSSATFFDDKGNRTRQTLNYTIVCVKCGDVLALDSDETEVKE